MPSHMRVPQFFLSTQGHSNLSRNLSDLRCADLPENPNALLLSLPGLRKVKPHSSLLARPGESVLDNHCRNALLRVGEVSSGRSSLMGDSVVTFSNP
jgi:hypothetical protein